MDKSFLILVETSIWVRFLSLPEDSLSLELDKLLLSGPVAICGPIYAELLSGVKTKHEHERLQNLLKSLVILDPPEDIWPLIGHHRFNLARKGIQSSLVDLWIALTADYHQIPLWTLDKDFHYIQQAIKFNFYEFSH